MSDSPRLLERIPFKAALCLAPEIRHAEVAGGFHTMPPPGAATSLEVLGIRGYWQEAVLRLLGTLSWWRRLLLHPDKMVRGRAETLNIVVPDQGLVTLAPGVTTMLTCSPSFDCLLVDVDVDRCGRIPDGVIVQEVKVAGSPNLLPVEGGVALMGLERTWRKSLLRETVYVSCLNVVYATVANHAREPVDVQLFAIVERTHVGPVAATEPPTPRKRGPRKKPPASEAPIG